MLDLSTPGRPHYGQWLDREEVEALFPHSPQAASKVLAWLLSHSIKEYKVARPFIDFLADVKTANTALGVSYKLYNKAGVTKLRTLQYSIPNDL